MGNDLIVITVFSEQNSLAAPPPYRIIEEQIKNRSLLAIQYSIYKILKKYEQQADIFHLDGHLFLYGAGLYRLLRGKRPISAFFNRELGCFPADLSTLFPAPALTSWPKLKQNIRWYIEKYIGMPIASRIDIRSFISPNYQKMYEDFGLSRSHDNMVIGDPMDFGKIIDQAGITKVSYIARNKRNGVLNIFYSSRMVPGKGFDILLTGFSKVKNKEKFRLIIGGDGPEEKLIQQMIVRLNLSRHVESPGWLSQEKLIDYLKKADIFIQADWRLEGTSMSLLRAMAFGIPSILPAGGGLEWNAKNSALYFKYKDCVDLANKIEQLGSDYELREELSRQCYVRLSEDEMNYEKNIEKLYEQMKKIASQ